MKTLEKMSDEELMASIGGAEKPSAVSSLSDDDLMNAIADNPEKKVGGVFGVGAVPESAYKAGERNALGNIFERPGAAIRSAIQGKGYVEGANNPTNVPTFQELALDKYYGNDEKPGALKTLGGNVVSAAGLAADVITNPADALAMLIGKAPGAEQVARMASKTAPAKAIGKALNTDVTPKSIKTFFKPSDEKIADVVQKGVSKIRPSVAGKRTAADIDKYYSDATEVMVDITKNKPSFVNEAGETVSRNPETLKETLDAIGQGRSRIFNQYDSIAKQAGESGSKVNLDGVVSELNSVAKNKLINLKSPQTANYAAQMAERFKSAKSMTTQEAQELVASFNADLQSFYKNPSYNAVGNANVDAMAANIIRKNLDETIETATGQEYQPLKTLYGKYKKLEKDVAQRAVVDARKNDKGLIDFADIFSSGDVVAGVAYGQPALVAKGGAQMIIKNIFKRLNDPNNAVKNMFKDVEKQLEPDPIQRLINQINAKKGAKKVVDGEPVSRNMKNAPASADAELVGPDQVGFRPMPGIPNLSAEGQGFKDPRAGVIVPPVRTGGEAIPMTQNNLPPLESGFVRMPNAGQGLPVGAEFQSEAELRRQLQRQAMIQEVSRSILNPSGENSVLQASAQNSPQKLDEVVQLLKSFLQKQTPDDINGLNNAGSSKAVGQINAGGMGDSQKGNSGSVGGTKKARAGQKPTLSKADKQKLEALEAEIKKKK